MASTNQNINNPIPCVYNCGIQIYWNTSVNKYWKYLLRKNIFVQIELETQVPNTATTADSGITPLKFA